MTDYSKAALIRFVDTVSEQGLVNANTANGWKAACARIFEDLSNDADMRSIDVPTAIKRYHNKHAGTLKPSSLKEYERRLVRCISDFIKYTDEPTAYKPKGRGPSGVGNLTREQKRKPKANEKGPMEPSNTSSTIFPSRPTAIAGLSLEFPMRADFLAQVLVPRDMKTDEARRFTQFILTLAQDYKP